MYKRQDINENRVNFCGFQIDTESIGVSPQSVRRMHKKAKKLIDRYVQDDVHNQLESIEQPAMFDDWFSQGRNVEKSKNKLLDSYDSVVKENGIVVPAFEKYIRAWLQNFEVVDDQDSLMDAVELVFDHWKQTMTVSSN